MVKGFVSTIDNIHNKIGAVISWGFIPLLLILFVETAARYLFNKPIVWSWDIMSWLNCALVVLGGGYVLLQGGHVIMDVLVTNMPGRRKRIIDIVTYSFFILAFIIVLVFTIKTALASVQAREINRSSLFYVPLYPIKCIIPVGVFLFLLEIIVKFLKIVLRLEVPQTP